MKIENKTSFSCKKRTADKGINLRLIFSSLVLFLTDPKTIIRHKNFNFANSIILQFLSRINYCALDRYLVEGFKWDCE
ncbi:hypothetical protein P8452_71345 [Trifolium repens]|nr:hypothetical protein P8452_71345 [Trifolium repens]